MSKKWIKISTYIVLPLIVIGGFLYWATWTGSTDDIERVANQLQIPSSWKLVSSEVVPPKTDCIGMTCPRLSRTWETPHPVTRDEINKILANADWNEVRPESDCQELSSSSSKAECWYYGQVGKYSVRVAPVYLNPGIDNPKVSIYIKEK